MEAVSELLKQDLPALIVSILIVMSGITAVVRVTGSFSSMIGKPVSWIKNKNSDHELLLQTVQALSTLQKKQEEDMKHSDRNDQELRHDIKRLTDLFIEKEINDMRWEINHFATTVSEGKPCSRDSYKHCIHTYEKYERLLKEQGLENGEIEISMQIINESYKQKLKDGF